MTDKEIIIILEDLLLNKNYKEEIFTFIFEPIFGAYKADIIIKAGKKNIAAIEFQSSIPNTNSFSNFTTNYFFLYKVRYYIYTDGLFFYIYDRFNNPKNGFETDGKGFKNQVNQKIPISKIQNLKISISKIFEEEFIGASNIFPYLDNLFNDQSAKMIRELKLSFDYSFFFQENKIDTDSFEHQFFITLLDNHVPETIYRYCSFNRAFQILNDETISMLGLPGMNDTTEPNYVENYLNDSNDNLWDLPPQSIDAINRRFIMSCTIHYDNLMQWRLYGDDAKGVCIKFKVPPSLSTNHRFYLGKVKYADENNQHPELLFLKKIIKRIREELFFDFKFALLFVWRHFFKPKEYDYEGEVRLLYIHRKFEREKKWIIAEPYSIVNPMVIFDLNKNEFPLDITEIMLGPKKIEKLNNIIQLKQMLKERGKKISITESKRNVYR